MARVFSAFLRVTAVISPVEADVSSRVAACLAFPCAKDWLEEATWPEAAATWREPSIISCATCRRAPPADRTTRADTAAAPAPAAIRASRTPRQRLAVAPAAPAA